MVAPIKNSKIIAYTRTSTGKQDNDNQKLEIYEYARKQGMTVDEVLETQISSRKSRLHGYFYTPLSHYDFLILIISKPISDDVFTN